MKKTIFSSTDVTLLSNLPSVMYRARCCSSGWESNFSSTRPSRERDEYFPEKRLIDPTERFSLLTAKADRTTPHRFTPMSDVNPPKVQGLLALMFPLLIIGVGRRL